MYLFTFPKFATLCPLALPVTLDYRQGRALGTEGGKVVGTGRFDCWKYERRCALMMNCAFVGLQRDECSNRGI